MAKQLTEKRWLLVGPLALIANGTVDGILEVADSKNLYVKRPIWLRSSAFPEGVLLEIKGFITDTRFYVGPHKENIGTRTDVSAYLVADGATVTAPEHSRSNIPQVEHERAVFEEEPVLAKRVILVDEYGNHIGDTNPLPVSPVSEEMAETHRFAVTNIAVAANVEQSYALPDSTRKVRIKMRDGRGPLRIYAQAAGTDYLTIERGSNYISDNMRPDAVTLYFQSSQSGTLEIALWYAS